MTNMENSQYIDQLQETIDQKIEELTVLQEALLKACSAQVFVAISVIETANSHNIAIELRGILNYLNMRNSINNKPPIVYSVHSEILQNQDKN